jgi:hypothetical protein
MIMRSGPRAVSVRSLEESTPRHNLGIIIEGKTKDGGKKNKLLFLFKP